MRTFLAVVFLTQLAFLIASLGVLLVRRWNADRLVARRALEQETFSRALDRALGGELVGEALAEAIDRCHFETVATVMQERVARTEDDAWQSIVPLVRRTRWFEVVATHHTKSRLWWRRLVGARTLALVGDESDLPAVRRLLNDRHPAVRLAATSIIIRIPDADAIEAVLDQAVASRRVVRHYAFDTLASVGSPVLPVLRQRLDKPHSTYELGDLIRLAGTLHPPDLLDIIQHFSDHEDTGVRSAVARALGGFGDIAALETLRALLGDSSWQVRTRAASALGHIGSDRATQWLRQALRDANWWVRLRAAIALRQIGETGIDHLREAAEGEDGYAAEMARYTLGLTDAAVKDYSA